MKSPTQDELAALSSGAMRRLAALASVTERYVWSVRAKGFAGRVFPAAERLQKAWPKFVKKEKQ